MGEGMAGNALVGIQQRPAQFERLFEDCPHPVVAAPRW